MPPFRLEGIDKVKKREKSSLLMYAQNTYDKRVKITDWEKVAESYPIDNDPYCPGSLNFHLSHHNSFGFGQIEPYESETQRMLKQLSLKKELEPKSPNKYILNYFTYKDTTACESPPFIPTICPQSCAADYVTTMQNSYSPPYPFRMQRLALPKPPFLEYRRFKQEKPELSQYKFYDDTFMQEICLLQKHKKHHSVSTVPWTGIKTDGTYPEEKKQKCFKLEYLENRL